MVGDVRRQMGLVEPFGDWMGNGGSHSRGAAASGPQSWDELRNKIFDSHVGALAVRAARLPPQSACRMPRSPEGRFASLRDRPTADPPPHPAAAGPGGLWEA